MKCAVSKCRQNDSQKSSVSFYSFPKNDKGLKRLWIKFCNRRDIIKTHRERICSLHFKQDDYKRNLKFEMGFSNRATPKLKEGAVPTIDAVETEEETATFVEKATTSLEETEIFIEETKTFVKETTKFPKERTTVKTSNNQDSLQIYIKNLEDKMDALRKENNMLKMRQNQAEITIKNLSREVQKLKFTNANLQKAIRLFTER